MLNRKLFTDSDGLCRRDLTRHFEEGRRIEARKSQSFKIREKIFQTSGKNTTSALKKDLTKDI